MTYCMNYFLVVHVSVHFVSIVDNNIHVITRLLRFVIENRKYMDAIGKSKY